MSLIQCFNEDDMKVIFAVLFLVSTSTIFAAPRLKVDRTKETGPEGCWVVLSTGTAGIEIKEIDSDSTCELENGSWIRKRANIVREKFDVKYYSLKRSDILEMDCESSDGGKIIKGIARIKDDYLEICIGSPGGKRPTEFNSVQGYHWRMKRVFKE